MKLFARSLAITALAAGSLIATQRAEAQVAVDVDISLGGITILYYYDNINVNIPDAVLASLLMPAGCVAGVSCVVPSPGTIDATNPSPGRLNWLGTVNGTPAPTDLSSIDLNLQHVWAVRAIGGSSANTTVTIAGPALPSSIAGASGSIGVVSRAIATGASATCGPGSTTATFADPGLGVALQGSVCLELDFSSAVQGPFIGSGDTGDTVYTLQVTGT